MAKLIVIHSWRDQLQLLSRTDNPRRNTSRTDSAANLLRIPAATFGYLPTSQYHQQPRFQGPGGSKGFPGSPGAVPSYGMGPPPPGHGGMNYRHSGFQGPPPPGHFSPDQQIPVAPPGQQQMHQPRGPPPHMQAPPQQQQQPPIGG
ncbi:hypothetical protein LTR22_027402 [Elasticomyces elasticus]|nr:hypothetical protein LTR22_027402 [Elasticomyces elasticus]